jgi:CBS domain containing-hemolysin-like protein
MLETMAKEIMQPLPPSVTPQTLASEALDAMRRENSAFLPVVAPDSERFLGVVLRRALERGCVAMSHREAECLVLHHVKADVDFCFRDEVAEEVMTDRADGEGSSADRRGVRARAALRLPVIVVDEQKVPIGMIERSGE